MNSHVVIFNRSALQSADGWIHIVPKGELPNREAGIVQVLDDESLDSILAGIEKDKNRLGDKWPGIYAGREHFIYNSEQDSAALAWFKDFEKRDDGIWAKANGLTDIGEEAVKNRRYKFTSFVADRGDLKKISGNRYRVTKIETVGFTNQANGKELLTPITNRENFAGAGAPGGHNQQPTTERQKMKTVCQLLKLSADASEEAVHEAVSKLQNRITTLEPLEADNTKLKNRVTKMEDDIVAGILAEHKITDEKVINRLKPILKPLENRDERIACLNELGFKIEEEQEETPEKKTRVLNRGQGGAGGKQNAQTEEAEQIRATKIMNRAQELQKATPTLSLATATIMASKEIK